MLKKALSLLLTFVFLLFAAFPVDFSAAVSEIVSTGADDSGTTGSCKWELNGTTLTISGYGKMDDYYYGHGGTGHFYCYCSYYDEITHIIIKNGVTRIGQRAFYYMTNLKSITISDTVTEIGWQAFYSCTSLRTVHMGCSVTSIETEAFKGCTSLSSISLPDTLTNIDDDVFSECTSLQSIMIPDNVEYINNSVFSGCTSLRSVTIGDSVTSIGNLAFAGCESLSAVVIPDSVTGISDNAFLCCYSLTSLTIGNHVEYIGNYAFMSCTNLKSIVMPVSVKYVYSYAFGNCPNITDVYYGGSKKDWKKIHFGTLNTPLTNANIHCFIESVEHKIASDYGDDRRFTFDIDEEIEDLVFSQSSTIYNPRLSHFLGYMTRSAYTQELVKKNYEELGFDELIQKRYVTYDKYAAYNIGRKTLENGRELVMITIRGTNNYDELTDTDFNNELRDSIIGGYSVGIHTGFEECEDLLYSSLVGFLGDDSIADENITYVITGHSLGGAVGNLLAVRLSYEGVSNQNVYNYIFACPIVGAGSDDNISTWNNQGEYDNIINIGNWWDYVPSWPTAGHYYDSQFKKNSQNNWTNHKRFGVSYWFDNGFQNWLDAHDMGVYLDYLEKEYDVSHFRGKEFNDFVVQSVEVHCPVDVVIYDSQGNPIAGTTDNKPDYYGYEAGQKAIIFVDGDEKKFHIPNNIDFEVRLCATDDGEMEYGIKTDNLTTGESLTEKWFKSVQLTTGKEMIGKAVNVLDEATRQITAEDKLIVVGEATNEILESGEEIPYQCRYFLGDADDNGEVESVDATWIQRRLTDINTSLTDKDFLYGDVDGSGDLELTDATAIQYYLAQMKTPYLIGGDVVVQ